MSLIRKTNYRFLSWFIRNTWKAIGGLEVQGIENFPRHGPCIVIANHQSYLDPLLINAVTPRILHSMAKSTQFSGRFMGWWMPFIYTFPVRRYQTDPQAVRIVLRRLAAGEPVMIYVEGERTWDGRLQPPRLGTIRVLLKAGVPIIPVRIDGAYDVWPRWHRKIRPGRITIRFGPSIRFPRLDSRADREAVLAEARDRIVAALSGPLDHADSEPPDPIG